MTSGLRRLVRRPRHLLDKDFIARAYAIEWCRERLESFEERRLLTEARDGRDVCWTEEANPLVTVRIATYNRGQMVVDRSVSSALRQTYENVEVLVIGDAADSHTSEAVASITDERVRFINLPVRGTYPADPEHRWMVAGSAPMNAALALARGAWIAPCDDDDELSQDHVEVLLKSARAQRVEMIYSKARMEMAPGRWEVIGHPPLRCGHITHGSVLYSAGLRFMRHSNTSWKLAEPSDWNLWRRMQRIGVRIGFLDRVTYTHYLEAPHRGDHLVT